MRDDIDDKTSIMVAAENEEDAIKLAISKKNCTEDNIPAFDNDRI